MGMNNAPPPDVVYCPCCNALTMRFTSRIGITRTGEYRRCVRKQECGWMEILWELNKDEKAKLLWQAHEGLYKPRKE